MKKQENFEFIQNLNELLSNETFEFRPTQNKISVPLLVRIYKKMKAGLEFNAIKVCENLIIDSHHRYIASILAEKKIASFNWPKNHQQTVFNWNEVSLSSVDYDDPSEVDYHNFNDAKMNGIDVQYVRNILKS